MIFVSGVVIVGTIQAGRVQLPLIRSSSSPRPSAPADSEMVNQAFADLSGEFRATYFRE